MYSNASYYTDLSGNIAGIRVDIGGAPADVPINADNSDYQAIMALVESGELTIAPAE
tara:strand:- start:1080 stop:1250 length:171 start_codon:yes stop_codon:yes gene_type:complete